MNENDGSFVDLTGDPEGFSPDDVFQYQDPTEGSSKDHVDPEKKYAGVPAACFGHGMRF